MRIRAKSVARRCARHAGIVALGALSLGAGCLSGRDESLLDVDLPATASGTLQVPLTASAPSGAAYHLRNARFAISNPFVEPPVDTIVSGDSDVLELQLPPSAFSFDYTITLQDGWVLKATDADGSERAIAATLEGSSLQSFTIKPTRVTPLTYQFLAGGMPLLTGNGNLAVRVAVDDSLIDDFEDGDGQLIAIAGRNGSWFTFNDGTGIQTPAPDSPVLAEVVDASANYVLHTTGRDFAPAGPLPDGSFAFGAGVAVSPRLDPKSTLALAYDASGYTGIRFDATVSFPADTPIRLSFLVATSATTPVAEGGTCTVGCSDDFGFFGALPISPFSLSRALSWDQLTQQGFGTPVAFDPKTITYIKFILAFPDVGQPPSADRFDLQLDNVSFTTAGSSE